MENFKQNKFYRRPRKIVYGYNMLGNGTHPYELLQIKETGGSVFQV
jgi:hypothetical protein